MKIKEGFELREMCGEQIIIATGVENIDFSKIISLNETAAFLWNEVSGHDFTVEEMTELLTKNYEVDEKTASADAKALSQQWIDAGIVNP